MTRRRISVPRGSDLARVIEQAASGPVLLEKDGEVYELRRAEAEDAWAGYDPVAVENAITANAGAWADLDPDALIAAIYRARAEGSRPPTRP